MVTLADRESLIPEGNPNRPGFTLDGGSPTSVTIHETSNLAVGANAAMHERFVHTGGGTDNVSFHYVVDDRESIQLLPDTEVAWHAGDGSNGKGNRTSIAIETCVNVDGDPAKTHANLAKLVATLLKKHKLSINRVVQHNHWSGKNCPLEMRQNGQAGWVELLTAIGVELSANPITRTFPETGHTVSRGFLALWNKYGLEVCGYPLSEEYTDTDGYVRQDMENLVLEWKAGEQARIGAAIRRLKYGG